MNEQTIDIQWPIRHRVYKVYDTVEKKFWSNLKGKEAWETKGAAKNAVNANSPRWMRRVGAPTMKFSEQDRLVVVVGVYDFSDSYVAD